MSKTRGVITGINRRIRQEEHENELKEKQTEKMKAYATQYEEERYKTEATKQHERHRRNQKRKAYSVNIPVQPAKKYVVKPGTYFYGTLRKLAEDFKTIEEMSKYFTSGQLIKYEERNGKLWNNKTEKMVYDPTTGECNE
jgi:hypothetical protein